SSRYINDQFVTDSDILASNGIIHVLQGPLKAPPSRLLEFTLTAGGQTRGGERRI
ncbi:stabilin-2, partial [Scomber scombrus]